MIERILSSTKRIMSMMLVLVMLFALIPSLVIEASADIPVAVTTGGTLDVPAESGFLTLTVTPTFGDGSVGEP